MSEGIMKRIKILLEQGLSIEDVIAQGYRPSTVYAVKRTSEKQPNPETTTAILANNRRDEEPGATPEEAVDLVWPIFAL